VTSAHDEDDRSSVVTDESFIIAACKLRAGTCAAHHLVLPSPCL